VRGDNEWIEIGEGSNVQDNSPAIPTAAFRSRSQETATSATTSSCMGCTLEDGGAGRHGLDRDERPRIGRAASSARIGYHRGQGISRTFADHRSPARVIRTLSPEQVTAMGSAARFYALNGPRFKNGMKKIG